MSRRRALLMTAGSGGGWKTTPHDLTGDSDQGVVVSQISTLNGSQGPAWRAMDGLNEEAGEVNRNHSHTGHEYKPWWQIDFGRPVTVAGLSITYRDSDESDWGDAVSDLMVCASNDGEAWDPLAVFQYDKHPLAVTEVPIAATRKYRYYRIQSQMSYGYLIIGELEFRYKD